MKRGRQVIAVLMVGLLVALALTVLLPSGEASQSHRQDGPTWPLNADIDYQLGGPSKPDPRVGIVARDRTEDPAPGVYNICYVNGFQTQPGERKFWDKRPHLVLRKNGKPASDPGWPDEWLLDIRTSGNRKALGRILNGWVAGCARSGYAAVEYDNLDSWTRSRGLVRPRQAKAFAAKLTRIAHRHGLLAGQKNWAGWNGKRAGFDFAVAEQCGRWNECAQYSQHYGKRWVAIEYRRRDFRRACRQVGDTVAVVLRDRALKPNGRRAWC